MPQPSPYYVPDPHPDFTAMDYDSMRARVLQLIQQAFPSLVMVPGIETLLMETMFHVGEIVVCRVDNESLESKYGTARLRRSIVAKAGLIGFDLPGAIAAETALLFTISGGGTHDKDIPIPAGTQVRTQGLADPLIFSTSVVTVLPAGVASVAVDASHSTLHAANFTSTERAWQQIELPSTPYLDDSETVQAGDGLYVKVAALSLSTSTDRHYARKTDANGKARFQFGNGITGSVPVSNIAVAYRTGGGSDGNQVTAGMLTRVLDPISDADGAPVLLAVTNTTDADGGGNMMSKEMGKALIPLYATALTRCVGREDYEVNALRLTSVGRVFMAVADIDPTVDENSGILYVMPNSVTADTAPPELLEQVYDYLEDNYPWPATFDFQVQAAVFNTIDISARVWPQQGYTESQVRANILAALQAQFRPNNADGTANDGVDFGYYRFDENGEPEPMMTWGDLFVTVKQAGGVRKVEEDDFIPVDDVVLALREFPKLGTLTLINGDTGLEF